MEPAGPELRAQATRFLEAVTQRDLARVAELSAPPPSGEVFGIGSLPDELWTWEGLQRLLPNFPASRVRDSAPAGFCHGDVGWLIDTPGLELPTGRVVPVRITYVFVRRDDVWRATQFHVSEGVAADFGSDVDMTFG